MINLSGAAAALFLLAAWSVPGVAERGKIPLIQTTDLFHPPADPDDHLDLATVFALDEFDVRAVLLDRAVPKGRAGSRNPALSPWRSSVT